MFFNASIFTCWCWICIRFIRLHSAPASLIEENYIFNLVFSSARVIIEHVNGMLYCFNLRQRIQSRLLNWYLNIHYASSSAVASSSLLSNCFLTTFKILDESSIQFKMLSSWSDEVWPLLHYDKEVWPFLVALVMSVIDQITQNNLKKIIFNALYM